MSKQEQKLWENSKFIDEMQLRSEDIKTKKLKATSLENVQKKAEFLLKN